MNLREAYRLYVEESDAGSQARQLLDQQDWYAHIADFDPRSGDALPQGFEAVLRRLTQRAEADGDLHDRLWRLAEHSRAAVERILGSLSEGPRREQAILPIRDVKELDATSFVALSRRPGRNVREKLAGRPYMQAVRRYQSIDLPQNRLVKEFVTRLADLLQMRAEYLGHEDGLLGAINRWLRSEEAQAVSRWDNVPPNNALLAHRDYRRVWDAWKWMQTLDEDIDRDLVHIDARAETVARWEQYGRAYSKGKTLFGEMPVLFDYDSFKVEPWQEPVTRRTTLANRPIARPPLEAPMCVDLTYLRPRYASYAMSAAMTLPEAFLWQRWSDGRDAVDLELFDADIALLYADSTSVSCTDLFFARDPESPLLDRAAHVFTRKLSKLFINPELTWLVPDFLNDFQLSIARRAINARFPKAEPLPRSIAAVFDQIDYSAIKGAGFRVLVVDESGGTTFATKLIARHDPDLQDRVPETRGFYWERSPHVTLPRHASNHDALSEIPRIQADGRWRDSEPVVGLQRIPAKTLTDHPHIGQFDVSITVSDSPVRGGARLHDLQERAADIPLWRDRIPELSIKVIHQGRYQPFTLVDRHTTIRPLRGVPVLIPVAERFTLPAGRAYFRFPLFQGEDPDALGYVARLESPSFPLTSDTTCRLTMTYTYGADDPYRLIFEPLDGSFEPVRVRWQPKSEEIVTDAPPPEYPRPATWAELRSWRDAQGNEVDVLAWLEDSLARLVGHIPEHSKITISSPWREKIDGQGRNYWFAFATTEDGRRCYCNTKQLAFRIDGDPNERIPPGTDLYGHVRQRGEGTSAFDVSQKPCAMTDRTRTRILHFRERSLQNRISAIWSDSRSLSDLDCPRNFRSAVQSHLDTLGRLLPHNLYEQKMMPLLASMHKDAPAWCIEWISRQIGSRSIKDPRAVGSALGHLELPWQRHAFATLISKPSRTAIAALSFAIWRDQRLIDHFTLADFELALDSIHRLLAGIEPLTPQQRDRDKDARRKWARNTAEPLELLLGLLRSRASSNPEIHMLLQPTQEVTRRLAVDVERIAQIVTESNVAIPSRVQMSGLPPKIEGDRTPDLLYALQLYLTGDVGATTIRVTGVHDTEDE